MEAPPETESPVIITRKSEHQLKLDSLKIAQQKSDLLNAIQSLNSYQSFRAQNERLYHDRAAEEQLKHEIRKPLEDALEDIKLLTARVQRRDNYIQELRRLVALETLSTKHASASMSSRERSANIQSTLDNERNQIFELYDHVDLLEEDNRKLSEDNERLKKKIQLYVEQRKEHFITIETQQIGNKESLRHLEKERDYLTAISNQRENIIERVTSELVRTREEFQNAKKLEMENAAQAMKANEDKEKVQIENEMLTLQLTEKSKLFGELQTLSTAAREKIIAVSADNIELRKRYIVALCCVVLCGHCILYMSVCCLQV